MKEKLSKIKKDVVDLRENTSKGIELENGNKDFWGIYDSSYESIDSCFGRLLGKEIKDYIYDNYSYKLVNRELIAAELGGPGSKFFEYFVYGLFKKTVGFTLKDVRPPERIPFDTERKHEVIEADIFLNKKENHLSWKTVEHWVKRNGRPDILIERMVGGIAGVKSGELFLLILKRWYEILNENGTMMIEIPITFLRGPESGKIEEVLNILKEESQFFQIYYDKDYSAGRFFVLRKKFDAPETLDQYF